MTRTFIFGAVISAILVFAPDYALADESEGLSSAPVAPSPSIAEHSFQVAQGKKQGGGGGGGGQTCPTGYADCDGVKSNKCEANLQNDVNNCGACGKRCESNTTCDNGVCTLLPYCGDALINQAVEECDDGNSVSNDGCSSDCKQEASIPVCGNGIVEAGAGEECDDGNNLDTDSCTSTCQAAVCGDYFVFTGVEACDTGGINTATCDSDCTLPACGDGLFNKVAEECDDGNTVNGDGCSSSCQAEAQ